jgi:hypothetical protein
MHYRLKIVEFKNKSHGIFRNEQFRKIWSTSVQLYSLINLPTSMEIVAHVNYNKTVNSRAETGRRGIY